MHPAFMYWWKHARGSERAGCDARDCGPGFPPGPGGPPGPPGGFGGFRGRGHHGPPGPPDGGDFGVRRPLRFLAHKLDLSEEQTAQLAKILDDLKIERAQAEVDQRRTVSAFADAIEGATFGETRANEGGDQRVESAKKLREAVVKGLREIHALLDDDQRKRFAYLVRTGVLAL